MNTFLTIKNKPISPLIKKQSLFCYIDFKKLKIFLIVFCAVFFLSANFIAAGDYLHPKATDFRSFMGYLAYLLYSMCFDGQIYQGKFFGQEFMGAGIGAIDFSGPSSVGTQVVNVAKGVYEYIKPVGFTLIFLYCLLSIIEKAQSDSVTPEHIIKEFIKLLAAFVLINNGLTILTNCLDFANALYNDVGNLDDPKIGLASTLESVYNDMKGMWLIEALGILIVTVPMVLINLLVMIVMIILNLSRIIQIGIYVMFAPIGMANIYDGGLHSSGFRYLKKIFALAIQGAVMFGIIIIMNALNGAMSTMVPGVLAATGITLVVTLTAQLVISVTAVALMVKSLSFANDIVGV